ncbi:MAG: dTDP-4-dehydrorhamnose reductase [Planctomycetota bacterium]
MAQDEQAKVLVTGAAGMLGSQVLLAAPDDVGTLGTDLREAAGVDAAGVDLADVWAVDGLFAEHGPFVGVIHTAGYTAVDKAEEEEDLARRVNADATRTLAERCAQEDIPLLVLSTDFVFDGERRTPYPEDAEPNPLSAYGRTKLAGEQAALQAHGKGTRIVRTQWLYGPRGKHFPATILRLAQERDHLRVVADQFGAPTSTLELAPALWDVLRQGDPGFYHAACSGSCSWYEFAVLVLELVHAEDVLVEPCSTAECPRPAQRPAYSVLDCSRLARLRGSPLASWQDALKTYLGNEDQ